MKETPEQIAARLADEYYAKCDDDDYSITPAYIAGFLTAWHLAGADVLAESGERGSTWKRLAIERGTKLAVAIECLEYCANGPKPYTLSGFRDKAKGALRDINFMFPTPAVDTKQEVN